jgi:uncharacterized protein (TIGR00645 family)
LDRKEPMLNQAAAKAANDIAARLEETLTDVSEEVAAEIRSEFKKQLSQSLAQDISQDVRRHYRDQAPHQYDWEPKVESLLFLSRWLMAPSYLCLVIAMGGLTCLVGWHTWHFVEGVFNNKVDSIAQLIDILDLMLIGSLVVMVLIGGFENTISRINKPRNAGPSWVGNLEISHLKIKVAASIVLISGVHLLKLFLSLGLKEDAEKGLHYVSATSFDYNILAAILVHIVFIVSVLLLAWVDKILHDAKYEDK